MGWIISLAVFSSSGRDLSVRYSIMSFNCSLALCWLNEGCSPSSAGGSTVTMALMAYGDEIGAQERASALDFPGR